MRLALLIILFPLIVFGQSNRDKLIKKQPIKTGSPVIPAPPIPTYIGKGTFAAGVGNITPTLPAGLSAGDFMILQVQTDTEAVTAPAGWTEFSMSPVQYSTTTRISLFYRRYVGGDGNPTVTDPGDHAIGQIFAFAGCNPSGEPIHISSTSTAAGTTAFDIDCGVTTVDNILICIFVTGGADNAISRFSGYGVNASLGSFTQQTSEGTIEGAGGSIDLWTGTKVTAGDCGNITATLPVASAWASIVIGLKG
jgi:hypothetical protein